MSFLLVRGKAHSAVTGMRRKFYFRSRNRNDAAGDTRERAGTLPPSIVY